MKLLSPLAPDAGEKALTETERAELQRLRKDNAKLEMQLDFAKKVSTWFAKGQQ